MEEKIIAVGSSEMSKRNITEANSYVYYMPGSVLNALL